MAGTSRLNRGASTLSGIRSSVPPALRGILARSVVSRSESNVCDGSCFGHTQRSGTPRSAVQTRSARRPRIDAEEETWHP